jgi:hypothetical protein
MTSLLPSIDLALGEFEQEEEEAESTQEGAALS